MAKYSNYCKGCKLNCENGLLDLNNPPHKEFSFDKDYMVDFLCVEHQTVVHEKWVGEKPTN